MYLAVITLPILGSIVSGFLGRKLGISGAQLATTSCVVVTTFLSTLTFCEVGLNNLPVYLELFSWIDSEIVNIVWEFYYDSLTVSMLIPVLIVSSLVHIYSCGYMSHDPHVQRFMSYLSLFTFMMVVLVTGNNYLVMFVGWEGVGICSYLLVSFWFTRIAANQSSLSALLTNRVGDCFLTIGMFAMLLTFGNLDYATIFSLAPFVHENIITFIGICLLIGAMAKSSQLGLHVWLPQAMEGPTPVSALIHAATMVTAGVYLLMRSSPIIEFSPLVLALALWLGAITSLFSSLVGFFQQDIKKVIAYSTMSQLGMMVIAIGLSSYNIALFHLINHAFYKALLFLAAGSVIHAVSDNQDFRKYGGLRPFLPLTYSVILIASLSLVAFPFMTGFYSKDLILESLYALGNYASTAVYYIAVIAAMFTTLYSLKVICLTFLTNPAGPLVNYKNAHEGNLYMSWPLIILAILAIFFGYLTKEIYIGLGSGFFSDNSLFFHPSHEILINTEFGVPSLFKLLPLFSTVSSSVLYITVLFVLPLSVIYFKTTRIGNAIFSFFSQRFYIELFYNNFITDAILKLGGQTTKVLDKGSVETLGPYGLQKVSLYLSNSLASLDSGVITSYALYILLGLISYLLIPFIGINKSLALLILVLFIFKSITHYLNRFKLITLSSGGYIYLIAYAKLIELIHNNKLYTYIIYLWILGFACYNLYVQLIVLDFTSINYFRPTGPNDETPVDPTQQLLDLRQAAQDVLIRALNEEGSRVEYRRQQALLPDGQGTHVANPEEQALVENRYLAPSDRAPMDGNPTHLNPPGQECNHENSLVSQNGDGNQQYVCANTEWRPSDRPPGIELRVHHSNDARGATCATCGNSFCQSCIYESVSEGGRPLNTGQTEDRTRLNSYPIRNWDVPGTPPRVMNSDSEGSEYESESDEQSENGENSVNGDNSVQDSNPPGGSTGSQAEQGSDRYNDTDPMDVD